MGRVTASIEKTAGRGEPGRPSGRVADGRAQGGREPGVRGSGAAEG